ncbi:uncharacterized protein ARMOST_00014 [Armillaria ostoyae]|uniref:Uncharacterized protein n=1 Tax=Armillaria ostoyae TaxID=47428 RepID=A0A284QJY4_ARMOS|nr:uncharacterized protein ARMOST_00014 [Armillaria ostoyae]
MKSIQAGTNVDDTAIQLSIIPFTLHQDSGSIKRNGGHCMLFDAMSRRLESKGMVTSRAWRHRDSSSADTSILVCDMIPAAPWLDDDELDSPCRGFGRILGYGSLAA